MNRKEKRAWAQYLKGLEVCQDCPLLEQCYTETIAIQIERAKYGRKKLLPKRLRTTPVEQCKKA